MISLVHQVHHLSIENGAKFKWNTQKVVKKEKDIKHIWGRDHIGSLQRGPGEGDMQANMSFLTELVICANMTAISALGTLS